MRPTCETDRDDVESFKNFGDDIFYGIFYNILPDECYLCNNFGQHSWIILYVNHIRSIIDIISLL